MKAKLMPFSLLLAAIMAIPSSAHNVTFSVKDANTLNGVGNASIFFWNHTAYWGKYQTDAGGNLMMVMPEQSVNNYNYTAIKLGYYDSHAERSSASDENVIVSLIDISQDGIVKLTFNDMTMTVNEYCIFFADNKRQKGCYDLSNDTVQVIINKGYIISPRPTPSQLIMNPSNIRDYMPYFTGTAIALMFAFFFALIVIYYVSRVTKK